MMTDQRADEAATLHAHPSVIEIIAADYPRWQISRERDGAEHGDWTATRGETTLSAPTARDLLVALEEHELDRLRAEHGTRWKVWRTPRYWMATALVEGVEPTLMEETPDTLEARMENPGTWGQRPRRGGVR
jgi:hypothetical protein